jgi:hypothetical protein
MRAEESAGPGDEMAERRVGCRHGNPTWMTRAVYRSIPGGQFIEEHFVQ